MMNMMLVNASLYIWLGILSAIILVFAVFFALVPVNVWLRALVSGAHVSMARLIGMKIRKIDIGMLIDNYINAKKAGVDLTIDDLETHYLAGGNVARVVDALITAHGAQIDLPVATAKAIDLANRDILKAVQNSVNPVVIRTPEISAVSKDGIELKVKARVTVRSDVNKQIGGAGDDTIIARIGQGIVTTVGSAETHQVVLENPDLISKTILEQGLDEGTAYQILSIDIADIDVGRNIGAQLEAQRAEADMQIAQAKAEERRAMATATEQEMRAKTQEMRAKLIENEAAVPLSIAKAFENGQLGIMEYYKLKNVVADTNMRNALGGTNNIPHAFSANNNQTKESK